MEKPSTGENDERPGIAGWARNLVRAKSQGLAHEVLIGVIIVVVAIAIPLTGSAYTIQLATDVLTFATLAYGWNLISGFTGYLSFGQSSFFGLSTYTTGMLALHGHVPWYFAIGPAGLVAAAAAVLLGPIMLRLRGILFALGMFGLARILSVVFRLGLCRRFPGDHASGTAHADRRVYRNGPARTGGFRVERVLCAFRLRTGRHERARGRGCRGGARRADDARQGDRVYSERSAGRVGRRFGGRSRSYFDPSGAFDPAIDLRTVVFVLFGYIRDALGAAARSLS